MLTLTGVVEFAGVVGGGVMKKTGEVIPRRSVVQVKTVRADGRSVLVDLTVPDHAPYAAMVGKEASFPVRAYVPGGGQVAFAHVDR
jgi:hypothetical protein